jgi:hypothetical protein
MTVVGTLFKFAARVRRTYECGRIHATRESGKAARVTGLKRRVIGGDSVPTHSSSSKAHTISVITAASSPGAKPTDRSNRSGPVMSTRTGAAWVHREPGFMRLAGTLPASDHGGLDALAAVARDAFNREDRGGIGHHCSVMAARIRWC